jgi:hypothetical protein
MFYQSFIDELDVDLINGTELDFEINNRYRPHKITPIIRYAKVEDAIEIVQIYKDLYEGTYPYKEMEDVIEVRKMITNDTHKFLIFQNSFGTTAGCITFVLNFDQRIGYIRGFMVKKSFQGRLDTTKAMMGSLFSILSQFQNKISRWYVENRTAHSKSQYPMACCGLSPIAFFPNKDIFKGKIESDLMQILYDSHALKENRSKKIPILIPETIPLFRYIANRYELDLKYEKTKNCINLNQEKINYLRNRIEIQKEKDKFGYEEFIISLEGTRSFLKFLYTPQVQNCEKMSYYVENKEEFAVLMDVLLVFMRNRGVRYAEIFGSAYKPYIQQILGDLGFYPRGYIPSWEYCTEEGIYKDKILFNWFCGVISEIKLIDEAVTLLEQF